MRKLWKIHSQTVVGQKQHESGLSHPDWLSREREQGGEWVQAPVLLSRAYQVSRIHVMQVFQYEVQEGGVSHPFCPLTALAVLKRSFPGAALFQRTDLRKANSSTSTSV